MDLKVIRLLTLLSGIPLCSVAQPFNAYIKFDGFGDALFIDASEVLPTESDFTVEFWFKTCTDTVYIQEAFMGNGDDLEVNFFSNPPDTHHHYDVCALEAYGSPYHCYQNHFLIDSLWHHIAVTYHYSSTDFGFFFDGHGGMVTFDDDFDLEFNGTFYIGRGDRDNWLWNHFDGSMDEVRISNNIRYYSNFSPDTMPFTSDNHTMALWHMN
ncbi:MAG: LamG-like jellyroll fold domain-containing protein, partial [Flavobacteriales bacterium]